MRPVRNGVLVVAAAVLLACGGRGGGAPGGCGGGGGGGPTSCARNADCPLRYACHSGTCQELAVSYTSPTVVSVSPTYGTSYQGGYPVKDVAITLTFDRPVPLVDAGARVFDETSWVDVPATVTLSADEKTLSVVPNGLAAPAVVEVTPWCTDDWGHQCPASGYHWDFPSWIERSPATVSSAATGLTPALDGAGAALRRVDRRDRTCGGGLHVPRDRGVTWVNLWPDASGRLPSDTALDASHPSLASRGDVIAVVRVESGCNRARSGWRSGPRRGAGSSWATRCGPAPRSWGRPPSRSTRPDSRSWRGRSRRRSMLRGSTAARGRLSAARSVTPRCRPSRRRSRWAPRRRPMRCVRAAGEGGVHEQRRARVLLERRRGLGSARRRDGRELVRVDVAARARLRCERCAVRGLVARRHHRGGVLGRVTLERLGRPRWRDGRVPRGGAGGGSDPRRRRRFSRTGRRSRRTGLWGAWSYGGSTTTYLRADRYNQ
jgi:hypothetical protein